MNRFYNLPDVYVISHGEWADPEIVYNNRTYNYWDVDDTLVSIYELSETKDDFDSIEGWIAADTSMVYAVLEMLSETAIEEEVV